MISDERRLDAMIAKVQKLIERADHPSTPPDDAKLSRQRAEQIMRDYRIEEEGLIARDQMAAVPILKTLVIIRYSSPFRDWLNTLFHQAVLHVGGLGVARYENNSGVGELIGKVVAYDVDHRYLALIWSSIRLSFIAHLAPEYDPSLSEAENIYRLRRSGLARKDVAQKIYGKWTHSNSARVGKVYKEECARRGETPALDGRGIHLKDFREVYAREFVYRVWDRLEAARDGVSATGGAVELQGRHERVKEKFYQEFPDLRPKEPSEVEECEAPPPEATKARKRLAYKETAAYKEKQRRLYESPAALAGAYAGRRAGDAVEISRIAPRTGRLGEGTTSADGID